ncbi:MAG: energy transducer TonB [Sedimenticola sp.]|nr:MAG: energy transducer TonB [Sedimenticola sp.]
MSSSANDTAVDRLGLTLFFALSIHTVIILGISFNIEKQEKQPPPDRTLEIMVVKNPKVAEKAEKADFLAQTSQQGGGEEEKAVKPTTEMTPPSPTLAPQPVRESQPTPPPSAPPKPEPRKVITQQAPAEKKIDTEVKKPPLPTEKREVSVAQLLASTNQEIARLTAQLDKKTKAYAKRPRKKVISASTQEYKYASYLEAWRRKVENIGNLNYPDEAKRRKLYGNLVLSVAVRPDGTVQKITILKSSVHKLLDDSAIRIVKLAAPFAPFPAEIRKETDILEITRTWQFVNNNTLFSQ